MPKKSSKRDRVKITTHETRGVRCYALSDPHIVKTWTPPTSWCGTETMGYRMVAVGYENQTMPVIECDSCREEAEAAGIKFPPP